MALIPPFFLDAVVALGRLNPNKTKNWIATGFLYGHLINTEGKKKTYQLYLVTNRHVLDGLKQMLIRFDGTQGRTIEFNIDLTNPNGKLVWQGHPNSNIDIAVIRLNANYLQQQGAKAQFFRSDQHMLTKADCKKKNVIEGNGIFLLGFPMSLVGTSQNYVLVRSGDIARIRDCLDGQNDTFLVSVPNFPGNSGGPIVTKPEVVAITGTQPYSSSSLVGVISAYVSYRDVAVSRQTGKERIVFEENSGLAIAYPMDFVLDTIVEANKSIKTEAHAEAVPEEDVQDIAKDQKEAASKPSENTQGE